MKVFVFGSAGFHKPLIDKLPKAVKQQLLALPEDAEVLVGDCKGVDALVQKFMKEQMPDRKVTVYYSVSARFTGDASPRNYLAPDNPNWERRRVPVPYGITGRDFYAHKDKAMCRDADCGIAVWDGNSKGTERNILDLAKKGKEVTVTRIPEKRKDYAFTR